jgi:ADP-ribosylation factor-like protein 3
LFLFSPQGGTHSTPRKKLIFLGLDNAGKSSIVRALIGANPYTVAPTRGFNTREFEFDNISLNIFDIGGQKSLRSQWKTFWNDAAGIVWVVDSSDRRRLIETGLELAALLQDGRLKGVPILIFANKQDLTTSLSAADVHFPF